MTPEHQKHLAWFPSWLVPLSLPFLVPARMKEHQTPNPKETTVSKEKIRKEKQQRLAKTCLIAMKCLDKTQKDHSCKSSLQRTRRQKHKLSLASTWPLAHRLSTTMFHGGLWLCLLLCGFLFLNFFRLLQFNYNQISLKTSVGSKRRIQSTKPQKKKPSWSMLLLPSVFPKHHLFLSTSLN